MSSPAEPSPLHNELIHFTDSDFLLSIIVVCLLVFIALSTGIQFVFLSINKSEHDRLHLQQAYTFAKDRHMSSKKLLSALSIIKNCATVAFVILTHYLLAKCLLKSGMSIPLTLATTIAIITVVLIVIGDWYPQKLAQKKLQSYIQFSSISMRFLGNLLSFFSKKNSTTDNKEIVHSSSNGTTIDWKHEELPLSDHHPSQSNEHTLFEEIIKFGNTEAKHVMCPRIDVVGVDEKSSLEELVQTVTQTGYSRLPVYRTNFDEVVGVIYAKDLLPYIVLENQLNWHAVIREPLFVPENKKIDDLLKEFQNKKTHFAIVIDEYGGSSGIVTLEDVLEEIVGDITDEYDEEEAFYTQIDESTFLFDGRIELEDFYKIVNINGEEFEQISTDSETLGGFIFQFAGRIPEPQKAIKIGSLQLFVEESDKKRIKRVKVAKTHK